MISQAKWKWYGNAAHLIVSSKCRFHMATRVGKYLVSTVGEYFPDEKGKMDTIGASDDSFYETYVFKAGPPCGCGCGLPTIDGSELDGSSRWSTAKEANVGHLNLCLRYSKSKP